MSPANGRDDLIVLVADPQMRFAVAGLLERQQSLLIRRIIFSMYVHGSRDPGCRGKGAEFLKPFVEKYDYALILFDRVGCGAEEKSRTELEEEVEDQLANSGWGDRAAAVVLDPELEVWVWSDSPEVDRVLGWYGRIPTLRLWLREKGLWDEDDFKPRDPKAAMEAALRFMQEPRSAAKFKELASKVSVRRCSDPSFLKLRDTLRR